MEAYNVIFRGQIIDGHSDADVKAKRAHLFKVDTARVEAMFSGKPVILKKNCDQATAIKMKTVLEKAGAVIEVHPANPENTTSRAPQPSHSAPKPNPFLNDDGSPVNRAAQPAAKKNPFLNDDGSPATTTASGKSAFQAAETGVARGNQDSGGPGVLPPGSDLLSEAERAALSPAPVVVATDHIGLGELGGVLEESLPVPDVELDLSAYVLGEVGADVLADNEKWHFEALELDLSAFDLAEVGADVLREDERIPLPVVEVADADWDIAPAGSELGEIDKGAPPPPPNTDHLSLG